MIYKRKNKYSSSQELLEALFNSVDRALKLDELFSVKNDESEKFEKSRFKTYKLVSRLKADDLIQKTGKRGNVFIKLTQKGIDFFKNIQKNKKIFLSNANYILDKNQKSANAIIVSFDVPERFRNKRRWLRHALKNLEFEMIQQSFWMGKFKLPEEFINDLNKLGLNKHVKIFELSRYGNIKKVV